jgi:uncharacterized protein (DUF2132 family)
MNIPVLTFDLDHHRSMNPSQPRNPLHGVTLEQMLTELSANPGWAAMGSAIPIRCFTHEPSVASSLKFLRRAPWARAKVEALYLWHKGQ